MIILIEFFSTRVFILFVTKLMNWDIGSWKLDFDRNQKTI
jgi:hypothetical protein